MRGQRHCIYKSRKLVLSVANALFSKQTSKSMESFDQRKLIHVNINNRKLVLTAAISTASKT